MAPNNTTSPELKECLERMKYLEEENRQLREASWTFGELAERLNVRLWEGRRPASRVRGESRSCKVEFSAHTVNDKD
jgi:hypothetical protein